jgi:hypothetical protein
MAYPAVVLDHCASITNIECSQTSLSLTFTDNLAFQTALGNWSAYTSEFLFISFSPNCGNASATGARDFILVNKIDFSISGLSATASITHVDISVAVGSTNLVTVDLGNFTPGSANGTPGFSSSNGTSTGPSNSTAVDFDVALDQAIGFLSVDDPTYWTQLYPGVIGEDISDFAGENSGQALAAAPEKRRRELARSNFKHSLGKRGWFSSVTKIVKSAGSVIAKAATSVASTVKAVATDAATKVVQAATEAFDAVNPYTPHTYTPLNQDINIATPVGSASTPWGPGTELFSATSKAGTGAINIYCVGCGVTGTIHVKGTVTFAIAKGITEGSLSATGPVSAALELGIVASYVNTWTYEKQIAAIPLSPLSIAGLITIGPQVSLTAGGSLNVNAAGQLLAGAVLDWPAVNVNIDLANIGNSGASGFTPKVNPVFQVQGSVVITAEAYLLLSVGFGIDILNGKIKKSVALVEKPDLTIIASASAAASLSGGSIGSSDCAGVSINVAFANYVYADILGISQLNINTYNGPSFGKCLAIPKKRSLLLDAPNSLPAGPYRRTTDVNFSNTTAPTLQYTVMDSLDGALELHYANNGNIYAVSANSSSASGIDDSVLFSASNSTVLGDSQGRLFHGYVDTLSSLGVSRLRLANGDDMPSTSVIV